MAAKIIYAPETAAHFAALSKNEQVTIIDQVERLLADQPTLPSRKRKSLRPNERAQWELRLGNLRVFYDVTCEQITEGETTREETTVIVKAVGKKIHNQLWIGGERGDI
jgi:mRNA-degrading endonuclease RelE of RelBE toxin-antitoxin system